MPAYDRITATCRFKFHKLVKEWSMDSGTRIIDKVITTNAKFEYMHIRQQVGTVEELIEFGHANPLVVNFLYIVNRSTTSIITFGIYTETHLFKLKPGEEAFIRYNTYDSIGIVSDINDTSIDLITMSAMQV